MLSSRKGNRRGRLPSAGAGPGYAGRLQVISGCGVRIAEEEIKQYCLYLVRYVYFFCAIKN